MSLMISEDDIFRMVNEYQNNFIKLLDYSILNMEENYHQVLNLDYEQLIITSNSVKLLARVIPITYTKNYSYEIW